MADAVGAEATACLRVTGGDHADDGWADPVLDSTEPRCDVRCSGVLFLCAAQNDDGDVILASTGLAALPPAVAEAVERLGQAAFADGVEVEG